MKSVIVIGGGMAGLGAAWELARKGVPVTVLEAKSRWGGRILTIGGGTPIELGAEFVHGRNQNLLGLIAEAGLTTCRASNQIEVFEGGSLKQVKFWDKVDRVLDLIDPRQSDAPFAKILETQGLDSHAQAWTRGYVEGFNAADSERISAHSILRLTYSSEHMDGSWQARIEQGYGALIDFMAKQIKQANGNLFLDTKASHIEWQPGKINIAAMQQGRNINLHADAVVLTLPLGAWKAGTVSFRPGLVGKADAIRQLEFGNVVKLIFEFRERCWDKSFGFLHDFDEPFPTWWETSDTILTAWAGGPKADKLLHLNKEQLISQALAGLGRMMSAEPASLQARLANCHCHNWAADADIRGAYSYIPVNGLELPKLLAEPLKETLFFAGEATISDAQTGTTFGALESGLRAARQILGGKT
ncbi:MAG TPA: NAD(P)/FAD-dependent oxidoreductase [Verrucomicrobiae bacterium]|jgi:monoamine oxidase